MGATKILAILLPLIIATQATDQNSHRPVRHQRVAMQSPSTVKHSNKAEGKADGKTSKPLGSNKHYIPFSGYGGYGGYGYPAYGYGGYGGYPGYGGYDANPWTIYKRSGKPMRSGGSLLSKRHVSSELHTHSDKDGSVVYKKPQDSVKKADEIGKKNLGQNKHFYSPYGGFSGSGGYGYGGYGGYGYGADPRGYGYYGGWDANPWTMY